MGGKARIAKKLATEILERRGGRSEYLEPFVGGGWMLAELAPHFETVLAGDSMPDVALLWQAVQDGWSPPVEMDRATYDDLRYSEPSALRAYAGFGCSFGGRFFRGYATSRGDDYAGAAARSINRKRPAFERATVVCADYDRWRPGRNTLVYCDPPYAGTEPFAALPEWDADRFWKTAERWIDDGALVFVSEYAAPDGWEAVWSSPVKVSMNKDQNAGVATEHLFMSRRR